jgi:hypothetical protein
VSQYGNYIDTFELGSDTLSFTFSSDDFRRMRVFECYPEKLLATSFKMANSAENTNVKITGFDLEFEPEYAEEKNP